MEETLVAPVERAARLVAAASCAVALTGAGISTESGIPDFRSPGGLWERFDPMEYATLACFLRDPVKAWHLYRALGETLRGSRPNAAHAALADLERAGRLAGVVTQNIDGLHQAAGSRRVLEIHGSWRNLECVSCGTLTALPVERPGTEAIPRCPACARPLKPAVVLFGETVRHLVEIEDLLAACDVLLVVGTSAEVAPAARFPGAVTARAGRVVEFNLEACLPSDVFVPGPVGTTLPALLAAMRGIPGACA
jgi:NAD-dependent deacetylase